MTIKLKVQSGPRNARTDTETGVRLYTWEEQEYPSVTSVRRLAGLPIRLASWQVNKVIDRAMTENRTLTKMLDDPKVKPEATAAWLRQAIAAERDTAANLGLRVHDAVARGTKVSEVGTDAAPFLLQHRAFINDTGCEVLASEQQVWNRTVGYAGTFDFIARFPSDQKRVWLVDLKTGKGTYPEHALQLEAYARAEFVGEDDVINDSLTKLLHSVTDRAVLHLREDGWTFKVVPPSDETWEAFCGLLAFASWTMDHPELETLMSASASGKALAS